MNAARLAIPTRIVAGMLDTTLPGAVARTELGAAPTRAEITIYRVLGARHLVRASLTRRSGLRHLGAALDVAHAASMMPLLLTRRYRRAAVVQIAFAALLVALATREE